MFAGLWAIASKELLHVLRDPATRFVFVIPVFQLALFGYAIGIEVTDVPTAVVDLDQTPSSRRLVDMVRNTRTFDVRTTLDSLEEAERAVRAGNVRVAVVVPDGFTRDLLRGSPSEVLTLVDGSYSTEATTALATMRSLGAQATPRLADAGATAPGRSFGRVDVRGRLLFNPNLRSATFFVPGLVGIILQLITVLLTAFAIVRERELGTFEQLMVTPVSGWGLLVGKLFPYTLIALVETGLVLVLMVAAFDVPIRGSVPLLLALATLFVVTSLSLGVIISTFARTQAEAMQASFLVLLPSILLSGFIFPLQTIPDPIQPITYLIPVRYFIEILRGIIVRGAEFEALWTQAAALAVYTVVLLVIGAVRFRKRLD